MKPFDSGSTNSALGLPNVFAADTLASAIPTFWTKCSFGAVDQDGEVVDVYLQEQRDANAAKRFFQRFLKAGGVPREIITDKLRSYGVAHRSLTPESKHNTEQYANNRAELSHQPTRVCERGMRRFKSIKQAQRFLESHAAVYNLFNLHRHSLSRHIFKLFRIRSFATWDVITAP
jgi:putative transposase